jgi:8-amino-7-oxononanoate synthase
MNHVDRYLAKQLNDRKEQGNLRELPAHRAATDLFSNDYLGLSTSGRLIGMLPPDSDVHHASGSTGSRLLSGNSDETEQLEQFIARFHKAEAALLFNSGYDANMGLISSITSRHTVIIYDELCHASIIDGVRLSQCNHKYRCPHNDVGALEAMLSKYASERPALVIVESVYSMDGDMAPLADLADVCEQHGAQLIVDEAHATGVFGKQGAGMVCHLGLEDRVFARVHTFGKALGCHGAVVAGSSLLRAYLINFARSFIYTTALPAHSVRLIRAAYQYLAGDAYSSQQLHALIAYFRERAASFPGWRDSHSPIQALITGGNERTRKLAAKMQQAGLQVNPILSPTVPLGMERLRVCLHTFNTNAEINLLFDTL